MAIQEIKQRNIYPKEYNLYLDFAVKHSFLDMQIVT